MTPVVTSFSAFWRDLGCRTPFARKVISFRALSSASFRLSSEVNHNGRSQSLLKITAAESPRVSCDHWRHGGRRFDRTQRPTNKRNQFTATIPTAGQNERHQTWHRVLPWPLGRRLVF